MIAACCDCGCCGGNTFLRCYSKKIFDVDKRSCNIANLLSDKLEDNEIYTKLICIRHAAAREPNLTASRNA